MKTYPFIFSNQPAYRISRHLCFWLCWFVFVQLTFHYPTSIFPDWDIQGKMEATRKKFGVDYITLRGGLPNMIWEITYRQGLILLSYIPFIYAVIYYVFPRLIIKSKKWISTVGILALLFTLFLVLNYWFTYLTSLDTVNTKGRLGITDSMPALNVIINRSISPIIFNLLTLVGIAITIKFLKRWWLKQKKRNRLPVKKQTLNCNCSRHKSTRTSCSTHSTTFILSRWKVHPKHPK